MAQIVLDSSADNRAVALVSDSDFEVFTDIYKSTVQVAAPDFVESRLPGEHNFPSSSPSIPMPVPCINDMGDAPRSLLPRCYYSRSLDGVTKVGF